MVDRRPWPWILAACCSSGVLVACWLGSGCGSGKLKPRPLDGFLASDTFPLAVVLALCSAFVVFVATRELVNRPDAPPFTWFDLIVAGVVVATVAGLAFMASGGLHVVRF